MVATVACSSATWASRAIVARSRKRSSSRPPTVRSTHARAADDAMPMAATRIDPGRWWSTPSASSFSQSAIRESGTHDADTSANDSTRSFGSAR